ncbi:tail fiber domain-containing protein [Winogradskyella eckloniae]|uniref:tail fiber domain-containing protein n=1 Tax=Winogradskyella eckloniae TaxID=1089306 RepID=UPI001566898C|nr:tail fiber domain-containing protein [Winogradskyella eckloniae]NRD18945.1 tail fiber domain-containing protein [Winogradskyella eckloniae]
MNVINLRISLLFSIIIFNVNAQVGIGNTNPQATLDIEATSTTSPANNDGILIPRMSTFPSSPAAAQDGMLIFYTGTGADGKGFYYWDQTTTSWIKIASGGKNTLDQAYDEGGPGAGNTITATDGALTINGEDGLLITGTFGSGETITATGAGTRLFFNPRKAAFRAGTTLGGYWDNGNIGNYSVAMGRSVLARGENSVAIGESVQATGENSTAFGLGSVASGDYSLVFGTNNTAFGVGSTSFGQSSEASGNGSTAFGLTTEASGIRSTAFGEATNAIGENSLAFGDRSDAIGNESTAFGRNTNADGNQSTAFGLGTNAIGNQSTAFGLTTNALGIYSTAFGHDNTASSYAETTLGSYASEYTPVAVNTFNNSDRIFTIGNGSSTANRSNALTVYKSGLININDEYNMPLTDGTANQVMTTDGGGTVTWQTPASFTDTDNQQIDVLNLNGTTLEISLQDDGVATQTLNLGSLSGDFDWGRVSGGNTFPATTLSQEIHHLGNVSIGSTNTMINGLQSQFLIETDNLISSGISNINGGSGLAINLSGNNNITGTSSALEVNNSATGNRDKVNIKGNFTGSGAGMIGLENTFSTTSDYVSETGVLNNLVSNLIPGTFTTGEKTGVRNNIIGVTAGEKTGVYNLIGSTTPSATLTNGIQYGVKNIFTSRTGHSNKYGVYTEIAETAGGIHYGSYADVRKTSGFAAFFIGRTSLGASSSNRYIMPLSDGTFGQVMTTNGGGTVTWQTPTTFTDTDDQTINTFSFNNATNILSLEIENDGIAAQTVNLSSLVETDEIDWYEENTTTKPNAITDDIYTQGNVAIGKTTADYRLDIENTSAAATRGVNILKTDNNSNETSGLYVSKTGNGTGRSHGIFTEVIGTGTGQKYGLFNRITSTTSGNQYGVRNFLSGATSAWQFGTFNNLDNSATGNQYGVYNGMRGASASNIYGVYNEFERAYSGIDDIVGVRNRFSNGTPGTSGMMGVWTDFLSSANGNYYGSRNEFQAAATGNGNKYGTYNQISSSAGGTHYGTYNNVNTNNGWAGYFIGKNYISDRLSIGELNNEDGRISILNNSGSTNPAHIQLTETSANDGPRIQFANASETTNEWTLFGRADNTISDSSFNFFHTTTGNILEIKGDGDVEVNGNLGVNVNNPNHAVHLPNNAFNNVGTGLAYAWDTYSDRRIKSEFKSIDNALDLLTQTKPQRYIQHNSSFKDGKLSVEATGTKTLGFIAQELFKVLPEAVNKPKDENAQLWSVDYNKVVPVAIKAIQELNDKNNALKETVLQLEAQLSKYENLEARLLALEKKSNTSTTTTVSAAKK